MRAIVLTAGLGTRLRPVTEKWAKPAVPFLNVPLMYYPLGLLEAAGVSEIVFNTHHLPEQIVELAKKIPNFKTAISPEVGSALGSGGGISHAKSFLKGEGDFLVCNGDEVILPKQAGIMERFVSSHRKSGAVATILVMEHPLVGTQFGGVWADVNLRVKGFGKDGSKFGAGLKGYHYIGLLLLNDRVFDYLPPEGESNILYDALTSAIAKGESVNTVVGDFTWFETGNPKDFLHATREALELLNQDGEDARALKKTCSSHWIESTKSTAGRIVSPSATCAQSAQLSGFVVVGDGVKIGEGARVTNSVLLPGSIVADNQTIDGQIKFD